MTAPPQDANLVLTAAAGYREHQIRPFLASLAHHSPSASLHLFVDRHEHEFQVAVRRWIANTTFHLLPSSGLRDFARKRKWARSVLKRILRYAPGCGLGKKILNINNLRYIAFCELLKGLQPGSQRILLVDSRDAVFQQDPFSLAWPALWSAEEDRKIEDCGLNSAWLKQAGGKNVWRQIKHHQIVCAGVTGGRASRILQYLQQSNSKILALARTFAFDDFDQGIHNDLTRRNQELDFTVFQNGDAFVANLGCTRPEDIDVHYDGVRLFNRRELPAILHQYDRHPKLVKFVHSKWMHTMPKPLSPAGV